MKRTTISAINQLNQSFYQQTAPYFAQSREFYWLGWKRLIPYIRTHESLRILDVGCGSGRFAHFLHDELPKISCIYQGIDSSQALLAIAAEKLRHVPGMTVALNEADMIQLLTEKSSENLTNQFDLVTAMGLLHHIPSYHLRHQLLHWLAASLAPGGLLFVSFWQPHRFSRYMRKHIDPTVVGISNDALEQGDYFLPWERGTDAIRYVHSASDKEITTLIDSLQLQRKAEFRADGRGQRENFYILLQK